MIFELTTAGLSYLNANPGNPPVLSAAKLGSGVNYIPSVTDTAIHGTEVYSIVPSFAQALNTNVLVYTVYLEPSIGPFNFGEIGLFLPGNILFALGANSSLLAKTPNTPTGNGNGIKIDCYISTVGSTHTIYSSVTNTEISSLNAFGSIDALPSAVTTQSNAYIVPNPVSPDQSLIAVSNNGVWTVSDYVQQVGVGTINSVGITDFGVTYTGLPTGNEPSLAYPGYLLFQILTGEAAGTLRVVSAATPTQISITNPFFANVTVGDTFSITAANILPQDTADMLGGIDNTVTSTLLNDFGAVGGINGVMLLSGANPMAGTMNLGGFRITNVGLPQADSDAVTKKFLQDELYKVNMGGNLDPEFNTLLVKGDTWLSHEGGITQIGTGTPGPANASLLQVGGYAWVRTPPTDSDDQMVTTTEWVRAYVASQLP